MLERTAGGCCDGGTPVPEQQPHPEQSVTGFGSSAVGREELWAHFDSHTRKMCLKALGRLYSSLSGSDLELNPVLAKDPSKSVWGLVSCSGLSRLL